MIRRRPSLALLLMLASAALPAQTRFAQDHSSSATSQLADASQRNLPDKGDELASLCRKSVEEADRQFTAGDSDKARAALDDAMLLAQKAVDAARQHHHRVKETEIGLRKAERRLEDISHSVGSDDQPPVKNAIAKIELIRKQLLDAMFGAKK